MKREYHGPGRSLVGEVAAVYSNCSGQMRSFKSFRVRTLRAIAMKNAIGTIDGLSHEGKMGTPCCSAMLTDGPG